MSMLLEGIRILDWTIERQGPAATGLLGDLGAEVIHVEQRGRGDSSRGMVRFAGVPMDLPGGRNASFEGANRNKKSISLDLKKERGREVMYRLVKRCDVFAQNFRQGVAARLGMDYDTIARHNPRIIYASASGWGPKGPEAQQPTYDPLGLARAGLMSMVGEPDMPPQYIVGGIADQMGAIVLAYGILAALLGRERLGIAQQVDTSHLGSLVALQAFHISAYLMGGREFPREKRTRLTNPLANQYRCRDGKWIFFANIQSDRYWPTFCRAVGIEELEKDPRFDTARHRGENCEELISLLDGIFATRTCDEWIEILKRAGDLVFSPVQRISDLPQDPQVIANEYITEFDHPTLGRIKDIGFPVTFSKTPASVRLPAPECGQHTEEVLLEVGGYTWEEIERLRDEEVI
jgi:crotonobetainyl-CoA:carnitine CoA-transferase CaiB-like acyl-CoA transferase